MIKIILDKDIISIDSTNENQAKVILQDILIQAIKKDASDIHIEPFSEELIVRMRVNGELEELSKFNLDIYSSLSTVIKLNSGMNITEKRIPQDGRTDIKIDKLSIDIRVSSIPTIYGEKIVLRLLNRENFLKDKSELGFSNKAINKLDSIISKNVGILLVTGPTGSGKTTTVYSLLKDLQDIKKNIMTIEDPVEYKIDGINQIQVNNKIGLTFDVGLKSILRQDPDVIILGEIRDLETAKTAIRAATTGHLVISTMHANDAVSSIMRLMDMQIDPYLISTALIGVISQKLESKVCNNCSHDIIIQNEMQEEIKAKVATGCESCHNTGYNGRTAIYEILDVSDDIRECIHKKMSYNAIRQAARDEGMITFEDSRQHLVNTESNLEINTEDIYELAENV